jgi:hypothetical protein
MVSPLSFRRPVSAFGSSLCGLPRRTASILAAPPRSDSEVDRPNLRVGICLTPAISAWYGAKARGSGHRAHDMVAVRQGRHAVDSRKETLTSATARGHRGFMIRVDSSTDR